MNESVWESTRKSRNRPSAAVERAQPANQASRGLYESTKATLARLGKDGLTKALGRLNVPDAQRIDQLAAQISGLEQSLKNIQSQSTQKIASLQQSLRGSDVALTRAIYEAQRLSALSAMAELIPPIAHDLNTPIANASLVAETLNEYLSDFSAAVNSGELRKSDLTRYIANADEAVSILRSATQRASELAGSLKQLAVDGVSNRHRNFELAMLVNDVIRTIKPTLRGKSIYIETQIPEQLVMATYPGALSQILINLLQNAAVHAFSKGSGGNILLCATALGKQMVRIQVTDDGAGMDGNVMSKLFTPFFTTRNDEGGSGLGLSHSKTLAEQVLGGTISANSRPGYGSCFTVDLPLEMPAP